MVTTDGFIYPNSVLMERQILNRKGFPESYNMELLLNFLDSIKNGMTAEIPVYSHEIYDILPDEKQVIQSRLIFSFLKASMSFKIRKTLAFT